MQEYPRGTVLGPFKKIKRNGWFGTITTIPSKVPGTDIPILCKCRYISDFMRSIDGKRFLSSESTLLFGKYPPTCWEDKTTLMNPSGGDEYTVTIGHPSFYTYALNKNGSIGVLQSALSGKKSGISILGYDIPWLGGRKTRKQRRYQNRRVSRTRYSGRSVYQASRSAPSAG